MITELYQALMAALKSVADPEGNQLIKHVDLWNQQVDFLEDEQPWPKPAVFIEFGETPWSTVVNGAHEYLNGDCIVTLHVVTDYVGPTSDKMENFESNVRSMDLYEAISAELRKWRDGRNYHNLRPVSTAPNHNHSEVIECLERYSVKVERQLR